MKIFIGYVPVIHRGYLKLWENLGDYPVYFLDGELLTLLPHLGRDVRACSGVDIYHMALAYVRRAGVISSPGWLLKVADQAEEIVMPDEDISHAVADTYLPGRPINFTRTWLRWDKISAASERVPNPSRQISSDEFDREFLAIAAREAARSSDWWRQVGGVLVDNGRVLVTAFNRHQPTDYTPYIDGDPRFNFSFGERIDLSTALHAEVAIIGAAAAQGISTAGRSLYVTTFPCPSCAYAIKAARIGKLYYRDGYSLLLADEILAAAVEIIKVA